MSCCSAQFPSEQSLLESVFPWIHWLESSEADAIKPSEGRENRGATGREKWSQDSIIYPHLHSSPSDHLLLLYRLEFLIPIRILIQFGLPYTIDSVNRGNSWFFRWWLELFFLLFHSTQQPSPSAAAVLSSYHIQPYSTHHYHHDHQWLDVRKHYVHFISNKDSTAINPGIVFYSLFSKCSF